MKYDISHMELLNILSTWDLTEPCDKLIGHRNHVRAQPRSLFYEFHYLLNN